MQCRISQDDTGNNKSIEKFANMKSDFKYATTIAD